MPIGWLPENEADHFCVCPGCGALIDMRDLRMALNHAGTLPHSAALKTTRNILLVDASKPRSKPSSPIRQSYWLVAKRWDGVIASVCKLPVQLCPDEVLVQDQDDALAENQPLPPEESQSTCLQKWRSVGLS